MLYLNPPYHIIRGVSLFRDHADPLQYYYLPVAPKLTRITDPQTGQSIPQLGVIMFRGRAGNGGFLNFDVNIGVEPKELEEIRDELKKVERLRQTPRLAPVLLSDGTVKMMLFGKQTGDVASGETPGPKFVLKIDQHAKPSLYGDNQAAFSVALDQEGVTILEQALQGEMSPIGIVYSLEYLALRPAYSVRVHADWDRVQKHFQETKGIDALFISTEIDTAVDKLIESRAIVIEVDTFVPEGEDTSGIISRRDQAVNEVRDMVTEAFFEPSLDPIKEAKDGWDKVQHLAERATAIAVTGGWGAIGTFKYKKVDYTRIDKKVLNVNMSERTTVKRSIYPQGHLTGLLRPLRNEGLDLNRFIIPVDIDNVYFERRRVKVIPRANFDEDAIGSINVNLRYGAEPKNVILDSAAARGEVDWASQIVGEVMKREVAYNYRVTFKGVDSSERPIMLQSPEQMVNVENLEINPRELYSVANIPIVVLFTPTLWKRYPNLEAQLRYADESNGIRMLDTFLLNEKQAETTWKMFMRDPLRQEFEYKLIYRAADHKDIVMPWVKTDAEQVIIRDPYPKKRTLMIVPNFDWRDVERAFVDVSYEDKPNRVSESQSFEFTEEDKATKVFGVDLVNPDLRLVAYQVTVIYKDGRLTEIPRSFTRMDRIIVRDDMTGHKIVLVRPAEDFAKKKLKAMKVEIHFDDSDNGLSAADIVEFKSALERAHFEYDYVDTQKSSYEYKVTYLFTNGMTKTMTKTSNAEELSIPIS